MYYRGREYSENPGGRFDQYVYTMPDINNSKEQPESPISATKIRVLSCIPLFLFVAMELIRSFVRPVFGQRKSGIISNILGWLPNFLAASAIISLGALVIILIDQNINKPFSQKQNLLLLITVSVVSLAGLITHEITQKGTGLYYDVNDIYATIAGTILGFVCYYLILIRRAGNLPRGNK